MTAADDLLTARTEAVAAAMDDIRAIEAELGVTREGVAAIRDRLIGLTAHRELFDLADFPAPLADEKESSFLYRLAQDDDDRFALYAQASRGHVETPAHDHTTWAVVVGFSGRELNRFYARSEHGVSETHRHTVQAGTGVAMLPDDVHSIHIDGPALNFHCYGLALERLDRRVYFNEHEGRWKPFRNVSGIREARTGVRC
jgi:predicted metal-dependent enzyme (double-stranded beta helix superfamily)